MKKLAISCLALLVVFSTLSFSQVKYTSSGYFGIGTTSPRDVFHLYQSSPDIYFQCSSSYQTKMKFVESSTYYTGAYIEYDASPNQLILGIHPAYTSNESDDKDILIMDGADGHMKFYPKSTASYANVFTTYALNDNTKCYIVSKSGSHNFYVKGNGNVFHKGLYTISDISVKENIQSLSNSIDLLAQLRPVTYNFKTGAFGSESSDNNLEFGLIAQEVETIIPEIVTLRDDGLQAINYISLIPMLIDAIQSQQAEINDLKALVGLDTDIKKSASLQSSVDPLDDRLQPILSQNVPNPFNENTIIRYFVPTIESFAIVNVYDLQGNQIKSYNITQSGNGEIMIPASELNPGLFIYNLIVDGTEVTSRRMVLTE